MLQDHPRLRGEKHKGDEDVQLQAGSPPLTRGKAAYRLHLPLSRRITPAYAGKSLPVEGKRRPHEDHPRLRGEKLAWRLPGCRPAGSPPLTRGKDLLASQGTSCAGITPAYAGKSSTHAMKLLNARDHPRLRGEKEVHLHPETIQTGSPPLTRGKALPPFPPLCCPGITPAYAGKSISRHHPQIAV